MAIDRMRRPIATASALAVTIAVGAPVGLKALIAGTDPPRIETDTSALVVDRHDRLLRPFPVESNRWRLPVAVTAVDPLYPKMLLAYEDARFDRHNGVDVRASAESASVWARRRVLHRAWPTEALSVPAR